MTTNLIYEHIVASMPPGVEKTVMTVLVSAGAVGGDHRIKRAHLVAEVFPGDQRAWSTLDRLTRLAVESLQQQGYPVLSDSGEGGYWLAANDAEKEIYIDELESRRARLTEKILNLRKAKKLEWIEPVRVSQSRFF